VLLVPFCGDSGTLLWQVRDSSGPMNRYLIEGDHSNEEADVSERAPARIMSCERLNSSGSEY
jgi:hypothetical protein